MKNKSFWSVEPKAGYYKAIDLREVEAELLAYAMTLEEIENQPFFGKKDGDLYNVKTEDKDSDASPGVVSKSEDRDNNIGTHKYCLILIVYVE